MPSENFISAPHIPPYPSRVPASRRINMRIATILIVVVAFCAAGCKTIRTSSLHCAALSDEESELIYSNLDVMLKSNGFTTSNHSETKWAMGCWANSSSSPLWKGHADFQVSAETNSREMEIDIWYFKGQFSANKALVQAITSCVQSNAPGKTINIKLKTDICPTWLGE